MNILILTGHPAQVHNFRILKTELESKGHKLFWIATSKDISIYLLDYYGIDYTAIERPGKNFASRTISLIRNTYCCFEFIRKKNIDIIISRVSPYAALAGFLSRTYHIALADTESSGIYNKIFSWFVSSILTAKSFKRFLRSDQIRFDGNIELFYLHHNIFKPLEKEKVAELLGIEPDKLYVIMRFVSWDAYHDKGLSGFTNENKLKAVKAFSKYARVFISSEKELSVELDAFRIKIPPEKMHDVLSYATLFFGESATMASESAVLGTPAIYLNENWFGSTDEEEEFGLLFNFKQNLKDQNNAIQKGIELLKLPELKKKMKQNREIFLNNKIDPTAFLIWFIENYPESFRTMRENPDYQYRFR